MNENHISGVDPAMPPNSAVSIYQQDGIEDFPVLKAFQQYIDAEQAKARKRLVTMGIFFALLTGAVIAIFVVMLVVLSQRNQLLNDRLVEFAMSDRNRPQNAPVVVQSPPQPADTGAIQALAAKLDEMQRNLAEREKKAEEAAKAAKAAAEAEAAKPKGPTPEQKEIARLKSLLDAEKKKSAAEQERRRQEELEAYRRKHYPELYRPAPQKKTMSDKKGAKPQRTSSADEIDEVLDLLDDKDAINYFDEDEESPSAAKPTKPAKSAKSAKPAEAKPAEPYRIPVEKPSSSGTWRIPTE
ncbi:MAG: hypothetical protein J6T51_04465 [Kiritimatiellae bacterium]|nr:hypothetical protein [Kiritimatiellia bacterium]